MEKEYIRKDGTRIPILIGGVFLPGNQDRGVSFIVDISELKKTQKALEETASELRRSNQELEQFAYIAAHDLREPLRTITGFINLLNRRYQSALDADGKELLHYIKDAANRTDLFFTLKKGSGAVMPGN